MASSVIELRHDLLVLLHVALSASNTLRGLCTRLDLPIADFNSSAASCSFMVDDMTAKLRSAA